MKNQEASSVVELSLNPLFRHFSVIFLAEIGEILFPILLA